MLKIFFFFLLCICSILATAPWLNEDKPNSTLTEGDIALEDAPDSNEQRSKIEDNQVHASASSPWNRKWENNIVPFTITTDFSLDQRSIIIAAMVEINHKTCISFVSARVHQKDFILFRKVSDGSLCSSLLGREGGRQHVNLTDECVEHNTVLHELMHVLGFQHEHSRHDRNKNIRIYLSNVKSRYKKHLELIRKVDPMDCLVRYDHKSITHYPEDAFSDYNNRKTIISKVRGVKVKSSGLSDTDVWKINYMYNCSNEGESVESSNEHAEDSNTNVSNIGTTTVDQQRRCTDETNTSQRPINQLPTMQSTIKQVQPTSSTTITETSIGTTSKMTTSTTTRPISILNKEIIKAVEQGNEATVRTLLNEGADVNARTGEYTNKTLLHITSEKGRVNVVSLLLDKGANIEARATYNWTPLHSAAWNGHVTVVSLLLDKGANTEARTTDNWTPLHYAAYNGHVTVVSLLLDKGANIEARATSNLTPLHVAAEYGHVNVVSRLLNKGANIEARATSNLTPLHVAAEYGHVNVVSLLLDKGANIEAKDEPDWTPLHYAARDGRVNVVSLLLDKGANIEARTTYYNYTPLHSAASNGHESVVSLLLDKGANIEAKTLFGSTPLDLAKTDNKREIEKILERKQRQLITG